MSECKRQNSGPEVMHGNSPAIVENVDVMTKKMQELSCEEREQALYELHGVSDAIKETDELVTQKLSELDFLAEKSPSAPALKLAKQLSLDYVHKLRIFFLRAEQFHTQRAAERMVRFFELKHMAFGESKLVKDIEWSDLSDKDIYWLKQGGMQILPQRDRAGRAVLWWVGKTTYDQKCETVARVKYFLIMKMLEDEELSKQGIVLVLDCLSQTKHHADRPAMVVSVYQSVPVRLAAIHLCYDQPELEPLSKQIAVAADKYDLCRFRSHFGSHAECQYLLMTFGIPRHLIPVTSEGELSLVYHNKWIEIVSKEKSSSPCIIEDDENPPSPAVKICVPGRMDVLLGRGRHGQKSAGNIRFKGLLEQYREIYEAGGTEERNIINWKIRESMKAAGSRFIKLGMEGWEEVPEKAVIQKISHAFRNLRSISQQDSCENRQDKRGREW